MGRGMITRKSSRSNRQAVSERVARACGDFSTGLSEVEGVWFMDFARRLWNEQEGQDIAEYAVMLAVILVIVVGTVRLIGSNANNVFSSVASSIQ
jgi:Flp pilus assembly pilin Flp